jgi:hypothetical protein
MSSSPEIDGGQEMDVKKLPWVFIVGILVSLYTTFVVQNLWNWFVIPAFHVESISFWGMYGLILVVGLLAAGQQREQEAADDKMWTILFQVLIHCVPEGRTEPVKAIIDEQRTTIWAAAAEAASSRLIGSTITFGIGWLVHIFLA